MVILMFVDVMRVVHPLAGLSEQLVEKIVLVLLPTSRVPGVARGRN
jgi:hypothetical protein